MKFWPLILTIVFSIFVAANAQAARFGDMALFSSIGQRLDANIPIVLDSDELSSSVDVRVVSPRVYSNMGFKYRSVMKGLKIELNKAGEDTYFLKVSSAKKIRSKIALFLYQNGTMASGLYIIDFDKLQKDSINAIPNINTMHKRFISAYKKSKYAAKPKVRPIKKVAKVKQFKPVVAKQAVVRRAKVSKPPVMKVKARDPYSWTSKLIVVVKGDDDLLSIARNVSQDTSMPIDAIMAAIWMKNRNVFKQNSIDIIRNARLIMPRNTDILRLNEQAIDDVLSQGLSNNGLSALNSSVAGR